MEYVGFGVLVLVAATAQALFGVGYGILLAPVGALITDPETAIAASIVTSSAIGLTL